MNKKEIKTEKAPAAVGPYSQGVQSGGLIFASGQIPLDPKNGETAQGGIDGQARQALENLKAVLGASGAALGDVVKTTVFLKDLKDFAVFNEIYASYFDAPYPARSCVEVSSLPKNVLIEIEAIAVKS